MQYEENQQSFLNNQHGHGISGCQISDATAQQIDASVRMIIDDTFAKTFAIMETNREVLARCAKVLLEKGDAVGEGAD